MSTIAPMVAVVVCTHNPRSGILQRALDGLKSQTLAKSNWVLRIIDNASATPVSGSVDLGWHPDAVVIIEPELGLTPARLRGISATSTPLVVFVDDDNVLSPGYLESVVAIARQHPNLGAWGGSCEGEFEVEPLPETRPYLKLLAIRAVNQCVWSNLRDSKHFTLTTPYGAGLCLRRSVCTEYLEKLRTDTWRRKLDRKGRSLTSAGDLDLALTACDIGLGTGLFPELRLLHVIPRERLQPGYLLRLVEGISYSEVILKHIRQEGRLVSARGYKPSRFRKYLSRVREKIESWVARSASFRTCVQISHRQGQRRAYSDLEEDWSPQ